MTLDRVFTRLSAKKEEGSHSKMVLKKLEEIDAGKFRVVLLGYRCPNVACT